ncbi:MAG: CoA transferase [Proteobacteria bacterium]|nr:CoA transferase [Pseudomonadota bacterium]MDA1057404.1 CoA transferase [Pseudomonadota bacterium]
MTATAARKPLDGLRVIDCATFIAGPFCATQLAEFGAEVIKVELPGSGDPVRKFGSKTECGETLVWLSEGRNKKSITLDLRKPEGAELLKQLVEKSDVLVENFQPGTLEKWGLGWEVLKARNPRLVMVRISAYGQTGPNSPKPGFGRIANAFGGISFLAGFPDRPPVTPGSATLPDYMAGIYGALGAMFALRALDQTGEGQVVDIGLYEPIFRILDELAPAFDKFGFVRQRMGPGTVNVVPHSHYPTKDNRWVAIACTNDKIFSRLADVMGREDVAGDGIYGTLAKREAARAEVDQFVADWTAQRDRDDVVDLCAKGEVPCGPVYAIDEIFDDPQYAARENIKEISDPRIGTLKVPNVVPRLTATPGGIDHLGPSLGQDNQNVFETLLGLDAAEIGRLREKGVI